MTLPCIILTSIPKIVTFFLFRSSKMKTDLSFWLESTVPTRLIQKDSGKRKLGTGSDRNGVIPNQFRHLSSSSVPTYPHTPPLLVRRRLIRQPSPGRRTLTNKSGSHLRQMSLGTSTVEQRSTPPQSGDLTSGETIVLTSLTTQLSV